MNHDGDLYEVLGVRPEASGDELKRAYRRQLRTRHPDVGGSAEQFRVLQEAWLVLGEPRRRAAYDDARRQEQVRERARERAASADRRSGPAPESQAYTGARAPSAPKSTPKPPARVRVIGHPGGSSRARYLEILRGWVADPSKPVAPTRVRRRTVPGGFIGRWLRLGVRLTGTLLVIAAGGLVVGMVTGRLAAVVPTPGQLVVAGAGVVVAALLSAAGVAALRTATDPERREAIRFNRTAAHRERSLKDAHRAAVGEFDSDLGRRPMNPRDLLLSPFSPANVERAPYEARMALRRALDQEAIARALSALPGGFTVLHDMELSTGVHVAHLVVGQQGLIVVRPARATVDAATDTSTDARYGDLIASAIGVEGVSAWLTVLLDADRARSPLDRSGPPLHFEVGIERLTDALARGLPGLERGHEREVDRLVERLERVAVPA